MECGFKIRSEWICYCSFWNCVSKINFFKLCTIAYWVGCSFWLQWWMSLQTSKIQYLMYQRHKTNLTLARYMSEVVPGKPDVDIYLYKSYWNTCYCTKTKSKVIWSFLLTSNCYHPLSRNEWWGQMPVEILKMILSQFW